MAPEVSGTFAEFANCLLATAKVGFASNQPSASRNLTPDSVIGIYPVDLCQPATISGFSMNIINVKAPSSTSGSSPSVSMSIPPPMVLPTYGTS